LHSSKSASDICCGQEDCAALCEQDSRCLSWTYVPSGPFADHPYTVRCELKASVGEVEGWMGMVTGLSSRAPPNNQSLWETVLVGYDPSAQQVFASRDLCGHSMTDLPAMPENPFCKPHDHFG